jgi:hypothetical protein
LWLHMHSAVGSIVKKKNTSRILFVPVFASSKHISWFYFYKLIQKYTTDSDIYCSNQIYHNPCYMGITDILCFMSCIKLTPMC